MTSGHPASVAGNLGPMDIIPVLDLARGLAVWAQGGDRSRYEPVAVRARARGGRRRGGADAARSAAASAPRPATSPTSTRSRAARCSARCSASWPSSRPASPAPSWWTRARTRPKARSRCSPAAPARSSSGSRRCALSPISADIVRVVGEERVVFSVDLRLGQPHPASGDARRDGRAARRGEPHRPGGGRRGLDAPRAGPGAGRHRLRRRISDCSRICRKRFPQIRLLAGGGVLARRDLERMRDAGCDGALVASAIHAGTHHRGRPGRARRSAGRR